MAEDQATRRHEVSGRPALVLGSVLLSVAFVAVLVAVGVVSASDPGASPARTLAKVAGLGLSFVVLGGALVVTAVRTGRGAYVEVGPRGLTRGRRGTEHSWPWSAVRYLEVRGTHARANELSRSAGSPSGCRCSPSSPGSSSTCR